MQTEEESYSLYKRRYQYQDKANHELIDGIDWLHMTQAEADMLIFNYINTGTMDVYDGYSHDEDYALVKEELEKATSDEKDAYDEGYAEGASMATAHERFNNYNGVGYTINTQKLADDSESVMDALVKMFSCGKCNERFPFEDAATLGAYYITLEQRDEDSRLGVLWHICKGCSIA